MGKAPMPTSKKHFFLELGAGNFPTIFHFFRSPKALCMYLVHLFEPLAGEHFWRLTSPAWSWEETDKKGFYLGSLVTEVSWSNCAWIMEGKEKNPTEIAGASVHCPDSALDLAWLCYHLYGYHCFLYLNANWASFLTFLEKFDFWR